MIVVIQVKYFPYTETQEGHYKVQRVDKDTVIEVPMNHEAKRMGADAAMHAVRADLLAPDSVTADNREYVGEVNGAQFFAYSTKA